MYLTQFLSNAADTCPNNIASIDGERRHTWSAWQDRSQERSRQLQQKRQAQPSPTQQQQALRGYVYGAQNDEVALRKAAQAIAR